MNWRWLKSYPFWICLAISSLIWYIYYLTNETTLKVKVNLSYVDVPEGYVITKQSKKRVNVVFEVQGNDVNSVVSKIKNTDVLISLLNVETGDKQVVEYRYLPSLFAKAQVGDRLNMTANYSVVSDSVIVQLEKAVTKKVPIVDESSFSIADGVMLMPNSGFSVDSVEIVGLPSVVNEINSINLGYSSFFNIDESFTKDYVIADYYPDVVADPPMVKYVADIMSYTESIAAVNIADFVSGNYMFFPDSVHVRYHVSPAEYDSVNIRDFSVNVHFPDGNYNTAMVSMDKFPDNVKVVDIQPSIVQYLIFEK